MPTPNEIEGALFNELFVIFNNAALFTCPREGCKLTRSSGGYFATSSYNGDTTSISGSIHCLGPGCGSQLPISTPKARSDCALAILEVVLRYVHEHGIAQVGILDTAYQAYLRRQNVDPEWLIKNFCPARILRWVP